MLSGARGAGCFREVAALHSDHLRQVPLYSYTHSMQAAAVTCTHFQPYLLCGAVVCFATMCAASLAMSAASCPDLSYLQFLMLMQYNGACIPIPATPAPPTIEVGWILIIM